ncbi:TPA: hypothetical protein U2B92_002070, partial [Streptococcus suis]|nr:hypothetical protein [Streptococcus suis]HEM4330750.1 hypothetical protein [Streptococcus suis]HEM5481008.1 hypothetical protein [Streptococcus suis]HEM5483103.1 hypothetical protein [Streptococcus suis]HEM5487229.1 hypothetical protein [Streptococcus suis]
MVTDQDYRWLAEDVYDVDALKKVDDPPVQGASVGDDKFVILSHPQDMINGMQAMA